MLYSPSFVLYLQKFYLKNTIQNITPFICYNSFHLETKHQAHDIYIKQTNHKLKVFYVGFFFFFFLLISLGFIETNITLIHNTYFENILFFYSSFSNDNCSFGFHVNMSSLSHQYLCDSSSFK